jgi:hypothetical protein
VVGERSPELALDQHACQPLGVHARYVANPSAGERFGFERQVAGEGEPELFAPIVQERGATQRVAREQVGEGRGRIDLFSFGAGEQVREKRHGERWGRCERPPIVTQWANGESPRKPGSTAGGIEVPLTGWATDEEASA